MTLGWGVFAALQGVHPGHGCVRFKYSCLVCLCGDTLETLPALLLVLHPATGVQGGWGNLTRVCTCVL